MKKKAPKKLRLSRETLMSLDHSDLSDVAGGTAGTIGCPTTQNMINSCAYCVTE